MRWHITTMFLLLCLVFLKLLFAQPTWHLVGTGRAFLLARWRSLWWPSVLWRQRCGGRMEKKHGRNPAVWRQSRETMCPAHYRSSTSSLAKRRISHQGYISDWTDALSVDEAREGVDVISSVNQSDPSVLFARFPIGVCLVCIRKINSFEEPAFANSRPFSGIRRYNGCICR